MQMSNDMPAGSQPQQTPEGGSMQDMPHHEPVGQEAPGGGNKKTVVYVLLAVIIVALIIWFVF